MTLRGGSLGLSTVAAGHFRRVTSGGSLQSQHTPADNLLCMGYFFRRFAEGAAANVGVGVAGGQEQRQEQEEQQGQQEVRVCAVTPQY